VLQSLSIDIFKVEPKMYQKLLKQIFCTLKCVYIFWAPLQSAKLQISPQQIFSFVIAADGTSVLIIVRNRLSQKPAHNSSTSNHEWIFSNARYYRILQTATDAFQHSVTRYLTKRNIVLAVCASPFL
jgi:hypothetical protein